MIVKENDEKKYFRSLLLLIGKNKIISNREKELLMTTCNILVFNGDFCKHEIENACDHNYTIDEHPGFQIRVLLKSF